MSGVEQVRIRPMRKEDLPRVRAIEQGLKDAPHWSQPSWETVLDPGASRRRVGVVAEAHEPNEVVGFAVAAIAELEAELESIGVAAAWQRRGAGRQILRGLIDELSKSGVRKVFLEVRASNAAALALYGSLRFEETGRRVRYYADPEEDAVLMRLSLG